jgi:riboflavin kinase
VPRSPRPTRRKAEEIQLLKFLAQQGGDRVPVTTTSRELGVRIGVSQQAADRYLMQLAEEGLVTRTLAARRQRLTLTPAALELLRREYHGYRRIFEGPGRLSFSGVIASGLGEGRYYLMQPGYVLQFTERLGYSPYPGTLNVRFRPEDTQRVAAVKDWSGLRIDGFQASGRTFGGATCFVARLAGRPCHLIVPDRTHHKDVVEFIAAECLRESLGVKDGDAVVAEIEET